jgi:hypothetical protein
MECHVNILLGKRARFRTFVAAYKKLVENRVDTAGKSWSWLL